MTRYLHLRDDRRSATRWHLGSPLDEHGEEIDPLEVPGREAPRSGVHPVLPARYSGAAARLLLAAFGIPVMNLRAFQIFARLGVQEAQLIPARVEAHPGPYFILNALRIIRCIDDAPCEEVQYWRPEDGQPEKVGTYRVVARMRIDPSKVGDARIFRPWGWTVAMIVSGELKEAMEREGISGTRFVEV